MFLGFSFEKEHIAETKRKRRFSQHLWPRSHRTIWYNQERISDEICDNGLYVRTLSDDVQISDF